MFWSWKFLSIKVPAAAAVLVHGRHLLAVANFLQVTTHKLNRTVARLLVVKEQAANQIEVISLSHARYHGPLGVVVQVFEDDWFVAPDSRCSLSAAHCAQPGFH